MQHPHRRWEGCRGDPGVNGSPEPERARGQAPARQTESGEKTLKPWRGETRVTGRKLDGLKSNPMRSMEGLWRPRLTARGTRRPGKRTAWATSAGPAPRHEGGEGMRGPPPSRGYVRGGGTAGWPTGREPSGHGASVVGGGRANRLQGAESPLAQGRRLPCTAGVRVGGIPQAFPFLSMGTGEPDDAQVSCPVRGGDREKRQ